MLRRSSLNLTLFTIVSDIVLTVCAIHLAKILRLALPYGVEIYNPAYLHFPWIIYPIVALTWGIVFLIIPVYDAKRIYRAVDQLQLTAFAIGFATLVFAGIAYFFFRELSRFLFLYFLVLDLVFLLGFRLILRVIYRLWQGGWPVKKTRLLILGAGRVGRRMADLLQDYAWYGVEVVGFLDDDPRKKDYLDHYIPYLGSLDLAAEVVRQYQVDEAILALPLYAHQRLVNIVRQLQSLEINVRVVPDLFELSFIKTTAEDFEGIPLISLREPVMDPLQQIVKRGFDLVVGTTSLLLALPVMGVIALAIKLDSPGPVLYTSERAGQNGRLFKMLKFRSMILDADERRYEMISFTEDGKLLYKRPDDPRVTRIGRFLRRLSLDELPQLINVLKGEMSLVGPRPELPWLVDLYEPWQRKRFCVPQGMTGWWQVNGRSNKPLHLNVEEDLYYIQNYSLLLDIIILWKTLGTVVKRSGAF